jgi:hypothetical protein
MNGMIFHFFNRDRLEGVQANVQGDVVKKHPLIAQSQQDFGGKMQASGRRGSGTINPAENGLITLGIVKSGMNVGRQGRLPNLVQPGVNGLVEFDQAQGLTQLFSNRQR